jgi:FeS assembly SUF system protein
MEMNEKKEKLKEQIVSILKTCYDPEIPVNIYELGLIYDVDVDDDNNAYVKMTLTSPACPVAGSLPIEVESKVKSMNELNGVKVDVVWDPPWDQSMMSEVARVELGFF